MNMFKDLNELITTINTFVTNAGSMVVSDLNAYISGLEAQVTAGKLDRTAADQQEKGPKDLIVLVQMIEGAIGPIPAGAGPLYVVLELAQKLQSGGGAGLSAFNTQAKLVLGEFTALAKIIPGLPF